MAVIARISRLFRADLHAVLDQVEEPELMLRQAIREMQDDFAAREHRIRVAASEQSELQARKRELANALEEIEEQIDLCFSSQKPELARSFIRRKLETERHAAYLASREAATDKLLNEQHALLEQHRMTLEGLRQKAEIFARPPRESGVGAALEPFDRVPTVSDDEVEVAYLREQSKRRTV